MKKLLSYLFVIVLAYICVFQVLVTAKAESDYDRNEEAGTINYNEDKTESIIVWDDGTKHTVNTRAIDSNLNKMQESEVGQNEGTYSNEENLVLSSMSHLNIEENLNTVTAAEESDIIGNIILSECTVFGAAVMYLLRKNFISKK